MIELRREGERDSYRTRGRPSGLTARNLSAEGMPHPTCFLTVHVELGSDGVRDRRLRVISGSFTSSGFLHEHEGLLGRSKRKQRKKMKQKQGMKG